MNACIGISTHIQILHIRYHYLPGVVHVSLLSQNICMTGERGDLKEVIFMLKLW